MNDAFESRLSDMRARLSNLSHTVEQQEDEHHQRRSFGHRYLMEKRTADPAARPPVAQLITSFSTSPSSARLSRPTTANSQLPQRNGVSERDVNQVYSVPKNNASPGHHFNTNSMPGPLTYTRAAKPVSGLNAMLQLARRHASISMSEATTATDIVSSTDAKLTPVPNDSVTIPSKAVDVNPLQDTCESTPTPLTPGGAAGLHSYRFQERFPSPRQLTPLSAVNARAMVPRDEEGRTPYHCPREELHLTNEDAKVDHNVTSREVVCFDAFRVVQERLRQKMKQLTMSSPQSGMPLSTRDAPVESAMSGKATAPRETTSRGFSPSLAVSDFEDSSPSPRPPRGTRSETATPMQSPDEHGVLSNDTPSPPSTSLRYQQDRGDASMDVEVLPASAELDTENVSKTRRPTHGFLHDFVANDRVEAAAESSKSQWLQGRMPSSQARVIDGPLDAFGGPAVFSGRVARAPSSGAHSKRTPVEQRGDSREYRRPPEMAIAERFKGARGRSERTTTGTARRLPSAPRHTRPRYTSSSMSATRSSASREGSASTAGRPYRSSSKAAVRQKPISLNVEANILCAVTGAELFALLRMRGLIESEGDTEEYRLPPARCHRLYVTTEEHRQLKLLRQSLRSLGAEEQRPDVPSYQRVTVSARARNAEFAPPPPVSHYMEV
ncbi:hypothetical protein NXY56_005752 [Leishmania guyanensis]